MNKGRSRAVAAMLLLLAVSPLYASAATTHASNQYSRASTTTQPGTITVQSVSIATHFRAYGRVQPIAVFPVRTVQSGTIVALRAVPGTAVARGQALAELAGPEMRALLTEREGTVRSTKAALAAAKRSLAVARDELSAQLTTKQAVGQAESVVAAATAALASAQARLRVAQQMSTLRAPAPGIVLAVHAIDGERVTSGQTILTLQTNGGLWLKAAYYGVDAGAIRIGMMGNFFPATGGSPVPIRVATVFGALSPDGGEAVGMVPASIEPSSATPIMAASPWLNGESGTVVLDGPTHKMVSVPSRALILDHAKWWVLVRTPQGDRPQPVRPGPTRGWETFIEQGLEPGQHVVVQDAYLKYHRGIAAHYQPPD